MMNSKPSKAPHVAALRFAVLLANYTRKDVRTDERGRKLIFEACSPGDWLNLQEGYFAFNNSARAVSVDRRKADFIKDVTPTLLRNVAERFNEQFREIAEGKPFGGQYRGVLNFSAQATVEGVFESVVFLEPSLSAAEFALWQHLTWSGITGRQILTCPVCDALALLPKKPQAGKQYYCSLRCSRRAAYETWLNSPKQKAKRAKARKRAKRKN